MILTVRSEGFEDRKNRKMLAGRARAYIKVNRREYSPRRRGFNVVTVNRKTGKILPCLIKNTMEKVFLFPRIIIFNIPITDISRFLSIPFRSRSLIPKIIKGFGLSFTFRF